MSSRRRVFVGAILLFFACVWFYFIDDLVLAGPIIAIGAFAGPVVGTLLGAIACFLWNVPQTLGFIKLLELRQPINEKTDPVAKKRVTILLENLAIRMWGEGGLWGWLRLVAIIFFVGPQMALIPVYGARVRDGKLRRVSYRLVAIYSVLFALPYATGAYWIRVSFF